MILCDGVSMEFSLLHFTTPWFWTQYFKKDVNLPAQNKTASHGHEEVCTQRHLVSTVEWSLNETMKNTATKIDHQIETVNIKKLQYLKGNSFIVDDSRLHKYPTGVLKSIY
jgi:hypothetical protein